MIIHDETIAGRDTVNHFMKNLDRSDLLLLYYFNTNSITFCMYKLAENLHVFKRLREEVGHHRSTYDDTREIRYLQAVINGLPSQCL